MLYEKETLKSVPTTAKGMLNGLSGYIFGLKLHSTTIKNMLQLTNCNLPMDSLPADTRQSLWENIGRAAADFDKLYNEAYSFRSRMSDVH